ncbi:MAG: helix-turn-helix domain-containing protein [Propioniciclava sp.]|uniref:IclR family transcriptional regulator domain-containing protein n=1 Tax=Propioniciclava sp. TaxID=2038686 RepID=UPI0039E3CEBF
MTTSQRPAGESSSLGQGLALLDAAVRRERSGLPGPSVSKLADLTGIERSRASRLTQELLDLGLLEKSHDGRLRAGPAYFAWGASRHDTWLRAARRDLRRLASRHRASVRLLAADGPRAVLLRYESAPGAPDAAIRAGMVTPIWSTGGGRALLWQLDVAQIADLLAGSLFIGVGGPHAARSSADVAARVRADRERGVVEAAEEFEYGVVELAFPVIDGDRVIAAVSAACHAGDTDARAALSREVVSIARELGRLATFGPDAADQ